MADLAADSGLVTASLSSAAGDRHLAGVTYKEIRRRTDVVGSRGPKPEPCFVKQRIEATLSASMPPENRRMSDSPGWATSVRWERAWVGDSSEGDMIAFGRRPR